MPGNGMAKAIEAPSPSFVGSRSYGPKGVTQVSFQIGTMIFQLVVFLILVWLLKRYVFSPLMRVMRDRQQYIENQINTAEQNRKEAERVLAENRAAIETARKEAHELLEVARKNAERQAIEIIAAAEAEARRQQEEAVAAIHREKQLAISELRDEVGILSVRLAGRILQREIKAAEHHALFEEALQGMGGSA